MSNLEFIKRHEYLRNKFKRLQNSKKQKEFENYDELKKEEAESRKFYNSSKEQQLKLKDEKNNQKLTRWLL